jgi:probable HAF family extracellular repeat protein
MRFQLARRLFVVIMLGVVASPLVTYRPCAWAAAFYNMGALPGTNFPDSSGGGVSPEGGVAVGRCSTTVPGDQPAQWTVTGGLVPLPSDPLYFSGAARDASPVGAYIVGQRQLQSNLHYRGFRYHNGLYTDLGDLPGGTDNTIAMSISYDGRTVVGLGNFSIPQTADEGFIWKEGVGIRGVGFLPGYVTSQALAISGDGNVVVGNSANSAGHGPAVRWTQTDGMSSLGDLPNGTNDSNASATTFDGSVIVGSCLINGTTNEAFRWTQATGMVGLGDLGGGQFYSVATSVSDDGSLVAGYSSTGATVGTGYEAFVWDADHGMRNARLVLTSDYGLNLTGWTLERINAISADGLTWVGDGYDPQGRFRGWVAVVPEPAMSGVAALVTLRCARRSRRHS